MLLLLESLKVRSQIKKKKPYVFTAPTDESIRLIFEVFWLAEKKAKKNAKLKSGRVKKKKVNLFFLYQYYSTGVFLLAFANFFNDDKIEVME